MTCYTWLLEISTLLIFTRFIFIVIYYLWFQEALNIRCSKTLLELNFGVFCFCGFFQLQIINKLETFKNLGTYETCHAIMSILIFLSHSLFHPLSQCQNGSMCGRSYASIKQVMPFGSGMYSSNTIFLPFDGCVCAHCLASRTYLSVVKECLLPRRESVVVTSPGTYVVMTKLAWVCGRCCLMKLGQTEVPVSMMVALHSMLEWAYPYTMSKLKFPVSTLGKAVSVHVSLALVPGSHFITCSCSSPWLL